VARQRLGQHFLTQGKTLDRIAEAACPSRTPLVIEIGPGKGALTERLIERADRLIAIELDPALAAGLRERFPKLEVVEADVMETDLNQWGPAVVAGNLPYYISTAIISRALAPVSLLARGVFLVQKEVAERITARPGGRDYGYLSVESQFHADVRKLFDVPPGAFRPPPKVDSTVIAYELCPRAADLGIVDRAAFLRFVRQCFRQKRKTLRNNLAGTRAANALEGRPEAALRAEQLSIEQFAELWNRAA
jgi:16S rRNA (adenine1518-N6/adenine1519-N6)-dimethyltransferase